MHTHTETDRQTDRHIQTQTNTVVKVAERSGVGALGLRAGAVDAKNETPQASSTAWNGEGYPLSQSSTGMVKICLFRK